MKPTGQRSEPDPVFNDKRGSDIVSSDRAAARADMPQSSARQTEPANPAMMASSILAFSPAAILMMWTPLHRPTTAMQLVDQPKQERNVYDDHDDWRRACFRRTALMRTKNGFAVLVKRCVASRCCPFSQSFRHAVLVSTVTDAYQFRSGRQFAAWLGLTLQQHSTGGKTRLGGISKQGDRYLRRLLVVGATAVMRHIKNKSTPMSSTT